MITSYHPHYRTLDTLQGKPLEALLPNCYITPGLVDLQVNGLSGLDFSNIRSKDSFFEPAFTLSKHGVTRFLATKITSRAFTYTPEYFTRFCAQWNRLGLSQCMGWHIEGPYLNPSFAGAHIKEWMGIPFDKGLWKEILATNMIRLVTQAPEIPQGMELLNLCHEMGVTTAIGHTNPSLRDLKKSAAIGCAMVTHLFNGMKQFHHRKSGIIGEVLGKNYWNFSLIGDLVHLDRGTVRLATRARPDGLILVSDMSPITFSNQASCSFGGSTIYVKNTSARKENGALAGSMCSLDEILHRFCFATGVPLQQALEFVTTKPLQVIQEKASSYSKDAVWWQKKSVIQVWINGSAIF